MGVRVRRTHGSEGAVASPTTLSLSARSYFSYPDSTSPFFFTFTAAAISATPITLFTRFKVNKLLVTMLTFFSGISLSTPFSLLEPFGRHFSLRHRSENAMIGNNSGSQLSNSLSNINLNSNTSNSNLSSNTSSSISIKIDEQNAVHSVFKRQAGDRRGKN